MKNNNKNDKKDSSELKWFITIFITAFVLSIIFSFERRTNLGDPVLPEVVSNRAKLVGKLTMFPSSFNNEYSCEENKTS